MVRDQGRIVMTDPAHYEVSYTINPWMRPDEWARDPESARKQAIAQWWGLQRTFEAVGLTVEIAPGVPGLPDMVFPANAAIVLDRRALLARFRHGQRSGEEPYFRQFFNNLRERGLIDEIAEFSPGVMQEGAGDCIWDVHRKVFWAGFGPRSDAWALSQVTSFFEQPVIALLLATEHFYHLDTCFAPLPGGEVLYLRDAFAERSACLIEELVPVDMRISATLEEAVSFSLNTVAVGRDLIMAPPPPRLRAILTERGYRCHDSDLSRFMLSGGAAYCMTLRLDLKSGDDMGAAKEAENASAPETMAT